MLSVVSVRSCSAFKYCSGYTNLSQAMASYSYAYPLPRQIPTDRSPHVKVVPQAESWSSVHGGSILSLPKTEDEDAERPRASAADAELQPRVIIGSVTEANGGSLTETNNGSITDANSNVTQHLLTLHSIIIDTRFFELRFSS